MSTFTDTELHTSILEAADRHKGQQLNFRFRAGDMLKLLQNLEKTPETESLIRNAFKEALNKSDKRPMTDQLRLKAKFQKSHGLVFKDLPINVERSVIFNSILRLGRTMDMNTGRLMFPGACKLRSFFFPDVKNRNQEKRVCFPIFVNKKDQMFIYQWAQNQGGKIQLELEGDVTGWNGVVSVELTRDECQEDEESTTVSSMISRGASFSQDFKRKASFSSSGFASPIFTPQLSQMSLNTMPFVNGPINETYNTGVNPLLVQKLLNTAGMQIPSPVMTATTQSNSYAATTHSNSYSNPLAQSYSPTPAVLN